MNWRVLFFLFIWISSVLSQTNHWTNLSNDGPSIAFHSGVNVQNKKLVTFGGTFANGIQILYSNDVHSFDYDKLIWTIESVTGDVPPGLKKHTSVLIDFGNSMLIFGGADTFGKPHNEVYRYTFSTQHWTLMQVEGEIPEPRSDHASAVTPDGKQMIVFGGLGSTFYNDLYSLDLENWIWKKISTNGVIPGTRVCHSAIISGNYFVIFGGLKSWIGDSYLNDVHLLNMETLTWRELLPKGNLPKPRSKHTANLSPVDKKSMIVFGGRGMNTYWNDIWVLNIDTEEWKLVEPVGSSPNARMAHSAVISGNFLIINAGFNDQLGYGNASYLNQLVTFQF